jgi:hypothetical protein
MADPRWHERFPDETLDEADAAGDGREGYSEVDMAEDVLGPDVYAVQSLAPGSRVTITRATGGELIATAFRLRAGGYEAVWQGYYDQGDPVAVAMVAEELLTVTTLVERYGRSHLIGPMEEAPRG